MRKGYGFVLVLALLVFQSSRGQAQVGSPIAPGDTLRYYLLPYQLPGLDLNFSGAGAAARGMGGAFTAVSGNLAAISINPAGLSTLDRTQTSVVYRYNRPGVRNRLFATGLGNSGLDNQVIQSFDQFEFAGFAGNGKLFGHNFVGAVAYTIFADQFFADQAAMRSPIRVDTLTQMATQNVSRKTSGKLAGFNLAAATRFGPISVGADFVIYQGGYADTTDLSIGPFYFRASNGVDTGYFLPSFDRQRLANKATYRGSSVILGLQADYRNARLGLAARVPAFTSGGTDFFRLKSNMDLGFYDSIFVSGLYQRNLSQTSVLFITDNRLELPLSISAGASYRFGHLLVDGDYTYTNWGAADLKIHRVFQAPFSKLATLVLGNAPVGLTSTHQVRLGWEVETNPGFGKLYLRGGLRNLPVRSLTNLLPLVFNPSYSDSFVRDAQGTVRDTISTAVLQYAPGAGEDPAARGRFWQRFGASAGLGIHWNQIALDLAYDYSTYWRASRMVSPAGEPLYILRRQREHRFFISFTGYFTRI